MTLAARDHPEKVVPAARSGRRFGRRDNAATAGKPSTRMRAAGLPGMTTGAGAIRHVGTGRRYHAAAARRELP